MECWISAPLQREIGLQGSNIYQKNMGKEKSCTQNCMAVWGWLPGCWFLGPGMINQQNMGDCVMNYMNWWPVLTKRDAVGRCPPAHWRSDLCGFVKSLSIISYPIGSMYGLFTYIWLIFMVNVGKYTIHGSYGYGNSFDIMNTYHVYLSWLIGQCTVQSQHHQLLKGTSRLTDSK